MSWLLAYFKGGRIAAIIAAVGAALLLLWNALANARKQGAAEQKAKEAERYAKDVDKAAKAARARDDVIGGRVQPDGKDPYRRD